MTMRAFAESFFKHFGAQLQTQGDEWVVDLPPDLAAVFGKPRLYLVFPDSAEASADLSPHEDLLAYGSRTFDRMLGLLSNRGEMTAVNLPRRADVTFDGDPPLPLRNCRRLDQQLTVSDDSFYLFNFRAVFLSDEKQERFISLALDTARQPYPEILDLLTGAESHDFTVNPTPSIEPALLRRLLAEAETLAHRQIEAETVHLEEAIRARLQKNLLRLTTYYRRLRAEVNTDDPAQADTVRADLEQDLQRKIAEEVERHRLQVTLSPLSYALVSLPLAHCRLTLATPHTQQTVSLSQNLYTGQVEPLLCHHCQQPLDQLALCDHIHPVHPHCLDTCRRCQLEVCHTCGIQTCAICQQPVCRNCLAACAHCQRWLCADHGQTCAICGLDYCPVDRFTCRRCGQTYCRVCGELDECATCRTAQANPLIPLAAVPAVEGAARYNWRQAENKTWVIYWGRHFWWGQWVIVTDKSGRILHQQKTGWLSRFFAN